MKIIKIIILVCCGAFFGIYFNLPIGALTGSFIAVATAQVMGLGAKRLNRRAKQGVQMFIGGIVGLNFNSELINEIKMLLLPGVLATLGHVFFAFILALLLKKYFAIDWLTALCGSIPAGMSEITVIANDIDTDIEQVILMHLFRVSMIVTILPFLLRVMI